MPGTYGQPQSQAEHPRLFPRANPTVNNLHGVVGLDKCHQVSDTDYMSIRVPPDSSVKLFKYAHAPPPCSCFRKSESGMSPGTHTSQKRMVDSNVQASLIPLS